MAMPACTIIPSENKVRFADETLSVDCSHISSHIHAVQWDGEKGEIEFNPDADGRRVANIKITDFSVYAPLVDNWFIVKQEEHQRLQAEDAERKEAFQKDPNLLRATEARLAAREASMAKALVLIKAHRKHD